MIKVNAEEKSNRCVNVLSLTALRGVNNWVGVGGAGVYRLLLSAPVGVARCHGAVRNRETR